MPIRRVLSINKKKNHYVGVCAFIRGHPFTIISNPFPLFFFYLANIQIIKKKFNPYCGSKQVSTRTYKKKTTCTMYPQFFLRRHLHHAYFLIQFNKPLIDNICILKKNKTL